MGIYDLIGEAAQKAGKRNDAGEPVINGFMLGIVTEGNNSEFPGMVKVELYVREAEKNISDWMRVVTPYGGTDWGLYMMPEVNDEVLVFFLEGSIHKPCVLGSIFRTDDKFHKNAREDKNFIKRFKTPNGIEVSFFDDKDKDYIDIKTQKGTYIRMDDEKNTVTIADKDTKNSVTVDIGKGSITVKADKEISMKSGASEVTVKGDTNDVLIKGTNVKIEGTKVIIKGQGSVSVDSATTEVKASASLKLEASGVANLKGSVVKIN